MSNAFASMSQDQLRSKLSELAREKFNFNFQKATGQLENVSRIRQVRRDIARVMTYMQQNKSK